MRSNIQGSAAAAENISGGLANVSSISLGTQQDTRFRV